MGNLSPRATTSAVGPVGPAPPLPSASGSGGGGGDGATADEVKKLQRRVDQLQSEIRMLRGGGDKALRMEELETKVAKLEAEKLELQGQVKNTEGKMAAEAGDLKVQRAGAVLRQADEVVNGLNDILSEFRINLMAAEGEVEQWAATLPKASFELVRESLRSCRAQMETAKELMRQLRDAGR
jgi:chromosome segregation ATPase